MSILDVMRIQGEYQAPALALLPLIPLCGALLCIACVKLPKHRQGLAGWIAAGSSFLAYLVSCGFWFSCEWTASPPPSVSVLLYSWFSSSIVRAEAALKLDALSLTMILVVTGVGSLIHLYAIGYMHEDESRPRFFSYFNLFLFFMLLLVLADNLILMFVGWEGVGLCSYLLIGFWYSHMPNAKAGQKAFVVNRIGDAGLLLGIFLCLGSARTANFDLLLARVGDLPPEAVSLIAFLLLLGALGKSAQIPLFVWLPDAMAGPTPVSALIHAATMVTAGIYMIARLAPLYSAAPAVQFAVLCIGAATALMAATIALVQYDIKKVLAYSTVSQLGYMFMALGVGAYSAAMFHLVTHAFFKGLLFMAAGSVIAGCHHEQDMRRFGGLWDRNWPAFLAFLAGAYAISGLPFGSGAYSKEAVLWAVYSDPGLASRMLFSGITAGSFFWALGLGTAFLTAFYITRALVLTFFGEYRGEGAPHGSPPTMLAGMAVLIGPAIFYSYSRRHALLSSLVPWTRPDLLGEAAHSHSQVYVNAEHAALWTAFGGVVLAAVLYTFGKELLRAAAEKVPERLNPLVNKWWVDELYDCAIVQPLRLASLMLFRTVDRTLIDGPVDGAAAAVAAGGRFVSGLHTGRLGQYLLFFLVVLVAGSLIWFAK